MAITRTYEETHPWITFHIDMAKADAPTWLALGEIQSKCEHIAGAPLRPEAAKHLHQIFLAKGLMATAAIEGNTLSEEEVNARIEGDLKLPPSKEYLGKEIDNVLKATNEILNYVRTKDLSSLAIDDIKLYNKQILEGLVLDKDTIAGEVRSHRVGVGRYRGAPPEDCKYLLGQMCSWLSGPTFAASNGYEIVFGVLKAVLAHLYIAWIHPFGDGNGRTARLVEVRILLEAGVPSSAAHLLSNHYNETRAEYYRQLDRASRNGGDVLPFLKYAADGYCSQLREQIVLIRNEQKTSMWENYVHSQFQEKKSVADYRKRHLMLAISAFPDGVQFSKIRRLDSQLTELYFSKTGRTVMRDVNALEEMGLVSRVGTVVRPLIEEKISGLLPFRKKTQAP